MPHALNVVPLFPAMTKEEKAGRLKTARISAGYATASDAADALGIKRPTYGSHENGTREFDAKHAALYARRLDVPVEWLLYGEGDAPEPQTTIVSKDLRPAIVPPPSRGAMANDVPVMGTAAGSFAGAFQLAGIIDYVRRPPGLTQARDIYAIFVEGSSMEPEHRPGELRFVNPHRKVRIGDSVVVQTKHHEADEVQAYIAHYLKETARQITVGKLNPKASIEFERKFVVSVHKVLTMNELFGM